MTTICAIISNKWSCAMNSGEKNVKNCNWIWVFAYNFIGVYCTTACQFDISLYETNKLFCTNHRTKSMHNSCKFHWFSSLKEPFDQQNEKKKNDWSTINWDDTRVFKMCKF